METRLAFSFDGVFDPTAPPTQQFNYDINWTGLDLFGTKLNLKTWAEYDPSTGFEQMNPDIHGFSWTYGPFKQNEGGRYTLSNLLEWNAKLTNLKTETNLIQHDLKLFSRPLSFKITFLTNKKVELDYLNDATLSTTLGTNFKLPFIGWRWATSFSPPGVEYLYGRESLAQYMEYTNTLSNGGRVNFLSSKDKYREGLSSTSSTSIVITRVKNLSTRVIGMSRVISLGSPLCCMAIQSTPPVQWILFWTESDKVHFPPIRWKKCV